MDTLFRVCPHVGVSSEELRRLHGGTDSERRVALLLRFSFARRISCNAASQPL